MMDYYQQQTPQQGNKPNKVPKNINTNVVLYLGELPPDVDQYELHQFIMSNGKFNVESLIVKPTKENKSYAYVKFKTRLEVEKAKQILHLKSLRNYVIKAEPFRQKESLKEENTKNRISQNSNTNLFVKNLISAITSKDLFELFSKFGEIISIKLRQNKNGECLGYGYVNFQESSSAEEAIKNLHDSQYQGKKLFVGHFYPKKERSINDEDTFPLVLMKNCPNNIRTEKDLQETFSKFGQISFCGLVSNIENKVTSSESSNQTPETESKLAVVLFSNKEEAEDAVAALNDTTLDDSRIPVMLSLAPINKETLEKLWKAKRESYKSKYEGCNLVVKNIPKDISERNLFEIGKVYGDLAVARISTEGKMKVIKDDNGLILDKEFVYESKGYGFVLYKNPEDASKAKEALNQKIDYKGQTLSLIVEYYDYTKSDKNYYLSGNNNPKTFVNRSPNKKKFFNNNNYNKNPKFNNQNKNYMKPQQIENTGNQNMPPRNVIMNKVKLNIEKNLFINLIFREFRISSKIIIFTTTIK
jgi:polyadenylate-binding protein